MSKPVEHVDITKIDTRGLIDAYEKTAYQARNTARAARIYTQMLGDTHAVHVVLEDDGTWSIGEVIEGDTVREVLSYLQFDPGDLKRAMRRDAERAVKEGRMSVEESRALLSFYENGLEGYTYLE